jgi:glycerol-3-phosphate O-acyltransferase
VGEWARVWPLSWLIRTSGAYFIRRKSASPLYRRVLARYVQMATEEGVAQAVFPEGGLSLDGRVGRPKLGILSYIVAGHRPGGRDVVFVPVSLAYDRVIEDRVLTAAAATGERRFRASPWAILLFLGRQLRRVFTGRFQKFGNASVSFGQPLSLSDFLRQPQDDVTAALADELMRRIAANVPVLPVPLICAALGAQKEMDIAALNAEAARLVAALAARGVRLELPGGDPARAVEAALAILTLRKVVRRDGSRLTVPARDAALVEFYAAPVAQHLAAAAA